MIRRSVKAFAIILCVLAEFSTSSLFAQNSEAIYGGKPESYWVNLLTNTHSGEFQMQWQTLGTNELPVLLKAVNQSGSGQNAAIRTNAAQMLTGRASTEILTALATNNSNPEFRRLALNGLIFKPEKTVTAAQVAALRDKNPDVRRVAMFGLGLTQREMTPEVLPALIKSLQDPDPDTRAEAASILQEPWFEWPGQNRGEADAAILAEIKRATNNPDVEICGPAIKAISEGEPIIQHYSHELALRLSDLHGTQWKATFKVIDESSKPIPDAQVSVDYHVPAGYGEDEWSSTRRIDGLTDTSGIFIASHKDTSSRIGFSVNKVGYYGDNGGHEFFFPGQSNEAKMASNRNPVIDIVLKKVIDPVPMYVYRLDFAHNKPPALDTPLGLDLAAGDWVQPYGKGTNAQIFFNWHVEMDPDTNTTRPNRNHGGETTLTLTFPNPSDGIQEFRIPSAQYPPDSELRSPQQAPDNGYQSKLVKISGWHRDRPTTNNYDYLHLNYMFRVQTALDRQGNVKSANYGKIYGDFEQVFSIYFNPEPNSRSLEFDMKRNLGHGNLGSYGAY